MVYLTFAKPIFLWFLLVIPLLFIAHYIFLARTQKKAMRFANFVTLKRISGERFVTKNITILILRMLIIMLFIFSLSGTKVWYESEINDYDFVITIDTSSSMVNEDISPTRFGLAKEGAIYLLDNFKQEANFGLVTFSSLTFIEKTLSNDRLSIKINLNSLNVTKNSGTDLSNAIVTATNVLSTSNKAKAIILYTDGSNTIDSSAEKPLLEAINYAKRNQVIIHAVGIGTNKAPVGYLPKVYNLYSEIDKDALDYITSETGGEVIYPENLEMLKTFYNNLTKQSKIGYVSYDFTFWGILYGFLLLFLEWVLINLMFRRVV